MVSGERRWERASRAMDLGELPTNFPINLAEAEGSPAFTERLERKRRPCLESAHLGIDKQDGRNDAIHG